MLLVLLSLLVGAEELSHEDESSTAWLCAPLNVSERLTLASLCGVFAGGPALKFCGNESNTLSLLPLRLRLRSALLLLLPLLLLEPGLLSGPLPLIRLSRSMLCLVCLVSTWHSMNLTSAAYSPHLVRILSGQSAGVSGRSLSRNFSSSVKRPVRPMAWARAITTS
jgi:hypothetical protein